ncbi:hypothetical protein O181_080392 [Austropuccinia psidii MF-1]|uniref:Uncharacterized protein n=1 Tax=Austropuccinia psidii MF-1 TaxID=1389203 RepID=A0A9Q3FNT8_9BASI|nr:hypothetical protein [Austropuccinia psidii MF-1]
MNQSTLELISSSKDKESLQQSQSQSSLAAKFKTLPPQKQFAFMTLAALGTAILVTGRTVRVILKKSHLSNSSFTHAPNNLKSGSFFKSNPSKKLNHTPLNHTLPSTNHINLTQSNDQSVNFNPAADAMAALGLATCLVIGTSTLFIKFLSNRWQLDGWQDWRIFIQSGHLGTALIPNHFNQTASSLIPNRLRPQKESSNSDQVDFNQWDWKKAIDQEWIDELRRRENEKIKWDNQRAASGKRVW